MGKKNNDLPIKFTTKEGVISARSFTTDGNNFILSDAIVVSDSYVKNVSIYNISHDKIISIEVR